MTDLEILPTTELEFDNIIDRLMNQYPQLTDRNHTIATVSVAIRHLPNDCAYSSIKYLGDTCLKNLANGVAYFKSERVKHVGHVNQLKSLLEQDPNNQQARDELEKAASEGFLEAQAALKSLEGTLQDADVTTTVLQNQDLSQFTEEV